MAMGCKLKYPQEDLFKKINKACVDVLVKALAEEVLEWQLRASGPTLKPGGHSNLPIVLVFRQRDLQGKLASYIVNYP